MEERKGFLTPEQEQIVDDLYEGKGIDEALDGPTIRLADNLGLQRLKEKIPPEVLPFVYEIIDEVFNALKPLTEKPE